MRETAILVAQICNLLYRGSAIRSASAQSVAPAGYKPAIQQIANLRYG
jgi:hypothetical protein